MSQDRHARALFREARVATIGPVCHAGPPSAAPPPVPDVWSQGDAQRLAGASRLSGRSVRFQPDDADRRLAATAACSSGIVDLADTDAAGLSRRSVSRRVKAGRLFRVHEGVFAVGHDGLDGRARATAALKACGPDAVLSHSSAAALWELAPWPAAPHVTAPGRHRLKDVACHRAATMPTPTLRHGLPTTLVPRLLLDLAEDPDDIALARVLNEALYQRRTTVEKMDDFLVASPGRRGVAVLRTLLPAAGCLHSPLEDDFYGLLRAARLPLPRANVTVLGRKVDFFWPRQRLVVETDGWAAHGTWIALRVRPRPRCRAAGGRHPRHARHSLRPVDDAARDHGAARSPAARRPRLTAHLVPRDVWSQTAARRPPATVGQTARGER